MALINSEARIEIADAPEILQKLSDLVANHDVTVSFADNCYKGQFRFGNASWKIDGDAIVLSAESADATSLNGIKLELGSSLSFVSGRQLALEWTGGANELTALPKLAVLKVLSVVDITLHMRRITFAGKNLERFAGDDNLHVKLAIPPARCDDPQWPKIDGNGRIVWPEDAVRPILRKYTIRSIDADAGTLAIDFVLHIDAGPGADFADRARPGDVIGMIGPGGRGVKLADWYLLAGDETALPAIGRILEALPETAHGYAIIEVANRNEEQALTSKAKIDISWLHRDSIAMPSLPDAVRTVKFPADSTSVFVWAGCEFDDFKEIRSYLRKDRCLKKDQHLAVSYWRRGKSEDEALKARDDEH